MNKTFLTLADLKKQGLQLSKEEANELLSAVSQHSQHTPEDKIVYPGEEADEVKPGKPETPKQKAAREKLELETAQKEYERVFGKAPEAKYTTEELNTLIEIQNEQNEKDAEAMIAAQKKYLELFGIPAAEDLTIEDILKAISDKKAAA